MAKRSPKNKKITAQSKGGKSSGRPSHPPDWLIVALAGVGMVLTAYLTGVAWWGETPAFCSAGSSCDLIQQSRWSTVLGLPLALWGFVLYALVAFFAYRPIAPMKRWKRVWGVSLMGMVLSVYLTLVGVISLDAVCLWCLLSLIIITCIFAINTFRRPAAAPEMPWWNWLLNSAIAALLAVVALHLYYNSDWLSPPPDPRLAPLAAHLDESGATFYGASWCTSCQRQKRAFGESAEQLPYVECSPFGRGGAMAAACTQAGVTNFPTWIVNDKKVVGVLEPEELARLSGFDWQQQ